jgi:YidC/Oxa1 family membrane protein insertase
MESDQKRMFLAIVLSGFILFGWQFYFGPKQSNKVKTTDVTTRDNISKTSNNSDSQLSTTTQDAKQPEQKVIANKVHTSVRKITLKSKVTSITFDTQLKFYDLTNRNSLFNFSSVFSTKDSYQIILLDGQSEKEINFAIENFNDSSLLARDSKLGVTLRVNFDKDGFIHFALTSAKKYRYRFKFHATKKSLPNHQVKSYVLFTKDVHRINVGDDDVVDGNTEWFGVDFNYHLFTTVFDHKLTATTKILEDGVMYVDLVNPTEKLDLNLLYTRKNYDTLIAYGHNLKRSVDFGFFGIIAVPLLRALQFFYSLIPNYGIAIILLTLAVRTLTFPLQFKSFKSMKKMQVVQPELQKLKEKYKDDPQRMQRETMELFKREGANPLGGCFPLLLQMPIFFAFYKVLYAAVELVGAPFFGWITDLSVKDPYYVLPVLMALSMFAQQKLTPSASADPTQQKVMMFMPLIFGVIMKDLPAGLNLYIFVSTIFGVLQQLTVYKMIKD